MLEASPKSRRLSADQVSAIQMGKAVRMKRARRKGRRKQLLYLIQYGVVLVLVGLLRLLPVEMASELGGWAGRTFLRSRMTTPAVKRTIAVAFPDANEEQFGAIIREMSDNVARVIAETAHLGTYSRRADVLVGVTGVENIRVAQSGGRGVLFAVGHLANWEVSPIALRAVGLDGAFAVMAPSNPYVFEWLSRLRMSVGFSEQVSAGEGVYKSFRRALKRGQAAFVLADQRLINGIRAPFFGREVLTNVIPARLARTLGIAVVPLAVRRVAGRAGHFEVEFLPALEFETVGDATANERAFTARINAFYESEILRAPGQWLWADPRWDEY